MPMNLKDDTIAGGSCFKHVPTEDRAKHREMVIAFVMFGKRYSRFLCHFKSWPIHQLMKRSCSGTILCGILPKELVNVPLPLVDVKVQRDLAAKVQSSFALRPRQAYIRKGD